MPGMGLIFWTTIAFGIVLYILKRYAWKPIMETIKSREDKISESLYNADKIKKEFEQIEEVKEKFFAEIEEEKQLILNNAKHSAEEIIKEAQHKAISESERIISDARKLIEIEKKQSLEEVKKQVAVLSIDMAEKVLEEEFADKTKQVSYINKLLEDVSLN